MYDLDIAHTFALPARDLHVMHMFCVLGSVRSIYMHHNSISAKNEIVYLDHDLS